MYVPLHPINIINPLKVTIMVKFDFLGISGERENIDFSADFDLVDSDEDYVIYQSKEEFVHEEDGLNFKYRYMVDFVQAYWLEGDEWLCSFCLVVSPESVHDKELLDGEETYLGCFNNGYRVTLYNAECKEENVETIMDNITGAYKAVDSLIGFYLDKPFNRLGTPNWNIIKNVVNGTPLFD